MTKREAIHEALDAHVREGAVLISSLQNEKDDEFIDFSYAYQSWYTTAIKAVESLASDRYAEFRRYYETDRSRDAVSHETYSIQDYFNKRRLGVYDPNTKNTRGRARMINCFFNQLAILKAIKNRVDSVLTDIEGELFAELEDNEVGVARQLIKISPRAAGALAGVVIEGHLRKVSNAHGIEIPKKNPAISDLNDPLKDASVIDTSAWRKISYLADLRNLCSHKKEVEPTKEQVADLLDGTEWLMKTVF